MISPKTNKAYRFQQDAFHITKLILEDPNIQMTGQIVLKFLKQEKCISFFDKYLSLLRSL